MEIIFILIAIFVIGTLSEKSDYQRMRDAEKLPSFTKQEAERYYYNELKSKKK